MREQNHFFRQLDEALGPDVPALRKIAAFKVMQDVAGAVMRRTIEDMSGQSRLQADLANLNAGIKKLVQKIKKG